MLNHGERADQGPQEPHGARRSALLRLGALCGLALSGDVLAALAKTTPASKQAAQGATNAAPELLTREELDLTGVVAELVIPQTNTPGALAVGAHRTVDHLLGTCSTADAQAAFKAGLARLGAVAQARSGKRFAALPKAEQTALLRALDLGAAPFDAADLRFFRQFKGYVAFAYYTSEAGATRELAYLPVPGGFTGHIKVTPATRTWAI